MIFVLSPREIARLELLMQFMAMVACASILLHQCRHPGLLMSDGEDEESAVWRSNRSLISELRAPAQRCQYMIGAGSRTLEKSRPSALVF